MTPFSSSIPPQSAGWNHTAGNAEVSWPRIDCTLSDGLLEAPTVPDENTDCRLDLSEREAIHQGIYVEKQSTEALTQAGLTYARGLRALEKSRFIQSHLEAAARCFKLAALRARPFTETSHREKSFARELKSLDKISTQGLSDKERLALGEHKIGTLRAMGTFCSANSTSYFTYLSTRIYQEAITISKIYLRKSNQEQRTKLNLQPKGHPPIKHEEKPVLNTRALIRQANYLVVAARHTSDIDQQFKLLGRAQVILTKVYTKDPMNCVDDPFFNFLDQRDQGFKWNGEFDREKTLLGFVEARLNELNRMYMENTPKSSWWDFVKGIFGA
ncbi:MAG: hypothetical protein JSR58_01415 [Verrucomicrobia bacterium]|nr:hypothetical protein [Verrucomicrobiota bacterium]